MKDLIKYFIFPELKLLLGKYGINLIILSIIVFFSITAIGIGNSSKLYLQYKMNSPFIRYVDVAIGRTTKVNADFFNNDTLKTRFRYNSLPPISRIYLDFVTKDKGDTKLAITEVISDSSEFFTTVLSKKPVLISGENIFSDTSITCIVSKDYLNKLGYIDLNTPYINYFHSGMGDTLPIKVGAVVSQLPRFSDILLSTDFYTYNSGIDNLNIQANEHKGYLRFYLPSLQSITDELNMKGYKQISDVKHINGKGIVIENNFDNSVIGLKEEVAKMQSLFPNCIRIYDYYKIEKPDEFSMFKPKPKFLTFSFEEIDSIVPFKNYLYNEFDLRIDMNTIESKKNFDFFSKLSNLLSIGLILFSIFAIMFFTINLILNHINKNKRSLGTLKAFGLENNKVVDIYIAISSFIVIVPFVLSYLLSLLLGRYIMAILISIFDINIDGIITYCNISFIFLIIAFIVAPLIFILISINLKLKNKTAGDLIYER
jgi:hypothetical protein